MEGTLEGTDISSKHQGVLDLYMTVYPENKYIINSPDQLKIWSSNPTETLLCFKTVNDSLSCQL